MTPVQKIRLMILLTADRWADKPDDRLQGEVSGATADEMYEALLTNDPDTEQDARNEVREGQVETGLPCKSSRHYESKSVASRTPSGDWVGWTYWHGGGKHGEPECVEWIEDAYALDCIEEEKLVTVRTFAKAA